MSQQDTPLSSAEVAEALGWSLAKVKREAADDNGALKPHIAFKMPGRTGAYLFNRAAIEAMRNGEAA